MFRIPVELSFSDRGDMSRGKRGIYVRETDAQNALMRCCYRRQLIWILVAVMRSGDVVSLATNAAASRVFSDFMQTYNLCAITKFCCLHRYLCCPSTHFFVEL